MPDKKTIIYLARHGQTHWNNQGLLQGSVDNPLNDRGLEQAGELAAILDVEPDFVFASPLRRAIQTAEVIGKKFQKPIVVIDGLKERSYGSFEGQHTDTFDPVRDALRDLQNSERLIYRYKDEETEGEALARFIPALSEIAKLADGKVSLIIGHGSIIRSFIYHHLDKLGMDSPYLGNTGFIKLEINQSAFKVLHHYGVTDRK